MIKKLSLLCAVCICFAGLTIGCSQGPAEVVVDESLKTKAPGDPNAEDPTKKKGAATAD